MRFKAPKPAKVFTLIQSRTGLGLGVTQELNITNILPGLVRTNFCQASITETGKSFQSQHKSGKKLFDMGAVSRVGIPYLMFFRIRRYFRTKSIVFTPVQLRRFLSKVDFLFQEMKENSRGFSSLFLPPKSDQ